MLQEMGARMITADMIYLMIFISDFIQPDSGQKTTWNRVFEQLESNSTRPAYCRLRMYMHMWSGSHRQGDRLPHRHPAYTTLTEDEYSRTSKKDREWYGHPGYQGLRADDKTHWFEARLVGFGPAQGISQRGHDDFGTSTSLPPNWVAEVAINPGHSSPACPILISRSGGLGAQVRRAVQFMRICCGQTTEEMPKHGTKRFADIPHFYWRINLQYINEPDGYDMADVSIGTIRRNVTGSLLYVKHERATPSGNHIVPSAFIQDVILFTTVKVSESVRNQLIASTVLAGFVPEVEPDVTNYRHDAQCDVRVGLIFLNPACFDVIPIGVMCFDWVRLALRCGPGTDPAALDFRKATAKCVTLVNFFSAREILCGYTGMGPTGCMITTDDKDGPTKYCVCCDGRHFPSQTVCVGRDVPTKFDLTEGMRTRNGLKCFVYMDKAGEAILGCANVPLVHMDLDYDYLHFIAEEVQALQLSLAMGTAVDVSNHPVGSCDKLKLVEQSRRFGTKGFPSRDGKDAAYMQDSDWHPSCPRHQVKIDYATNPVGKDIVSRRSSAMMQPAVDDIFTLAHIREFLDRCGILPERERAISAITQLIEQVDPISYMRKGEGHLRPVPIKAPVNRGHVFDAVDNVIVKDRKKGAFVRKRWKDRVNHITHHREKHDKMLDVFARQCNHSTVRDVDMLLARNASVTEEDWAHFKGMVQAELRVFREGLLFSLAQKPILLNDMTPNNLPVRLQMLIKENVSEHLFESEYTADD